VSPDRLVRSGPLTHSTWCGEDDHAISGCRTCTGSTLPGAPAMARIAQAVIWRPAKRAEREAPPFALSCVTASVPRSAPTPHAGAPSGERPNAPADEAGAPSGLEPIHTARPPIDGSRRSIRSHAPEADRAVPRQQAGARCGSPPGQTKPRERMSMRARQPMRTSSSRINPPVLQSPESSCLPAG